MRGSLGAVKVNFTSHSDRRCEAGRTHSAEDAGDLQDKVEFSAARDLARALCRLERLRLELREEKREARIIVMRVPYLGHPHIEHGRDVF